MRARKVAAAGAGAALLAAAALPGCTPAPWDLECTPLSEMSDLVNFCEDILLNASAPPHYVSTHVNPIVQDSLARQSSETVLNMATSCRLIVISDQCVQSYREYACVSNFLYCNNNTDDHTDAQGLLQPCRSMCFKYCEDCRLEICPCAHLPETNCYTHGAVLDWNATETSGGSVNAASSALVLAATAVATALSGRLQ